MQTTSSAGIWAALAGGLVLLLGKLGVAITTDQAVQVIAAIVTIIGSIHGMISHSNVKAIVSKNATAATSTPSSSQS